MDSPSARPGAFPDRPRPCARAGARVPRVSVLVAWSGRGNGPRHRLLLVDDDDDGPLPRGSMGRDVHSAVCLNPTCSGRDNIPRCRQRAWHRVPPGPCFVRRPRGRAGPVLDGIWPHDADPEPVDRQPHCTRRRVDWALLPHRRSYRRATDGGGHVYNQRVLGRRGHVWTGRGMVVGSGARMVDPPGRGRLGDRRRGPTLREEHPRYDSVPAAALASLLVSRSIAAESSYTVRQMSVRQRDGILRGGGAGDPPNAGGWVKKDATELW